MNTSVASGPICVVGGAIDSLAIQFLNSLQNEVNTAVVVSSFKKLNTLTADAGIRKISPQDIDTLPRVDYMVFFDDGQGNNEEIQLFVNTALARGSRLMFVTSIYTNPSCVESIKEAASRGLNYRTVYLGEIIPLDIFFSKNFLKIKKQISEKQTISLPTPPPTLYIAWIEDIVGGLRKALFSTSTKGKTIIFRGSQTDLLSMLQYVQSLGSGVSFSFGQNQLFFPNPTISEAVFAEEVLRWTPSLPWQRLIKDHFLKEYDVFRPKEDVSFWDQPKKPATKKRYLQLLFHISTTLSVIVVFWFLAVPFIQFFVGKFFLSLVDSNMFGKQPKLQQVLGWSDQSYKWLTDSKNRFADWRGVFLLDKPGEDMFVKSSLLARTATLKKNLTETSGVISKILQGTANRFQYPLEDYSKELGVELKQLYSDASFLETEIGEVSDVNNLLDQNTLALIRYKNYISSLQELVDYLPELLGVNGKRQYLILVFNNKQLRLGGGVVEAAGLIKIDKGRVINSSFYNSSFIDAQLKGYITPPLPIKNYLGNQNWSFKDSLWGIGFAKAAMQSAWFVQSSLGEEVDGVIAIDNTALDRLETINVDSSGGGYKVSGSQEPPEVVVERVLRKIVLGGFPPETILETMTMLEKRHIAVWIKNLGVQKIIIKARWDASPSLLTCDGNKSCFSDLVYPVRVALEGIGGSASYNMDLNIQDKLVNHRLRISSSGNNYFKIVLLNNAENIQLYELNEGKVFSTPFFKVEDEDQVKTVGFMLPSGKVYLLVWDTPLSFTKGDTGQVLLYWPKQLGSLDDSVALRVSIGDGKYKFSGSPAPTLTTASSVGYNTTLVKDLIFDLRWQKLP